MKIAPHTKKLVLRLTAHKGLMIICGVILCLSLIGATTYAYYRHRTTSVATTPVTPQKAQSGPAQSTGPKSKVAETTPAATTTPSLESKPQEASPTPAATSKPAPTKPTPAKPAPNAGQSSPSTPPVSPLAFSAGRIDTAYTSCFSGMLQYTIGGVTIGVNRPTDQAFSWRVELNDGTIFESDQDVMPAGSTIWYSFPSTPSYPSMIGTIQGANDGDMARLVITSPNYYAGGWSSPVPAGSEDRCRNGQM